MSSPPVRPVMTDPVQSQASQPSYRLPTVLLPGAQCAHFVVRPIPRIERIAGIKLFVVRHLHGLCAIEVSDIVLGRICCAPPVEQFPHALLDLAAVVSLRHNIVLMEDVAEEMSAVELVDQRSVDSGGQRFRTSPRRCDAGRRPARRCPRLRAHAPRGSGSLHRPPRNDAGRPSRLRRRVHSKKSPVAEGKIDSGMPALPQSRRRPSFSRR